VISFEQKLFWKKIQYLGKRLTCRKITYMLNDSLFAQIETIQNEITNKRKEILKLRKQWQPEPVSDYTLLNHQNQPVNFYSLFDERNELLVIHNMGKRCVYCTLWADEINGIHLPLANRVPFVVVSPDAPEVQKEFAASRNWQFNMLSAQGTSFITDLGFEKENESYWPGVSTFQKTNEGVFRVNYDLFGPGDTYCSIWHFMDLLPNKVNGWQPKYNY
jgi:predicted dithiol-disulfide oxidoreductase (DUF899 family)